MEYYIYFVNKYIIQLLYEKKYIKKDLDIKLINSTFVHDLKSH
jgi:hypothetical protein